MPAFLTTVAIALLAVLLGPQPVRAHDTQLSSARAQVSGNDVGIVLELNARDLDVALKLALLDAGGTVSRPQLAQSSAAIGAYLLARTRVFNESGGTCRARMGTLDAKADHVLAQVHWRCPPLAGALVYEATLFHEIDPAARHMFTASGDVRRMGLLSVATPRLKLVETRVELLEVLRHYFAAGAEHIAAGYDHIAFLLAVIVWGRRVWPLVGVITAFTVAHSLTLTLAVLGLVTLPARLVEPLIALSIVYVAAENFFVRDLRRRWAVTFAFGLLHGFGFAAVLRDYGLPADALAPALAAFNLGVEAGQLVVVLVAFSALHILHRLLPGKLEQRMQRTLPLGLSGCILLLGVYWSVMRLLSVH
jgi:hydrogenase/urease accessory protein HupE